MNRLGIGQPVRRVEDARFITGRGRYVGDIDLPGIAHGQVLLSPHAHAHITRIDVTRARAAPGVICVLKAVNYDALRGKSVISSPAIVEPVAPFHGPDHDGEPRFTDYDEGRL